MSEVMRILVVDDNPAMVNTLVDILDAKGFIVSSAASGADALEILAKRPIDILLSDVKMPNMNGLELYRKTRIKYPHLITIFITAYAADELIQQGLNEGVKTVLSKPVEIDFLLTLFSAYKRMSEEPEQKKSNFLREK